MKPIDERIKEKDREIHVWVDFWGRDRLVLAVIDGWFPPVLSEKEVRWLIQTLQKALPESEGQ